MKNLHPTIAMALDPFVNPSRTPIRGANDQEYQIYLACADDGNGGDITKGGAPLKSYEEWLNS